MRDFLNTLFSHVPSPEKYCICFTIIASDGSGVLQCLRVRLDKALSEAEDITKIIERKYPNSNVYLNTGLLNTDIEGWTYKRGGKKDIKFLSFVGIDIDVENTEAHCAQGYPPNIQTAIDLIMPSDPSMIVNTGNGVHAYYILESGVEVLNPKGVNTSVHALSEQKQEFIKKDGWKIDEQAKGIDRMWRVPGFKNHKTDPAKPVFITHSSESRFKLPDISEIPARKKTIRRSKEAQMKRLELGIQRLAESGNEYFQLMLENKPVATSERNSVLMSMLGSLVNVTQASCDAENYAEALYPCLIIFAKQNGGEELLGDEIDKVVYAADRFIENYEEDTQSNTEEVNIDPKRAILQHGNSFFIFDPQRQEYSPPKIVAELPALLSEAWGWNPKLPYFYLDSKGKEKTHSILSIKHKFTTAVDDIKYDYTAQQLKFLDDGSRTVLFPCGRRLKHHKPEYSPEVDRWLTTISGDSEILKDWLACVIHQEKACTALYIAGPKSIGKNLLAHGIGSLYKNRAISMVAALTDRFNSQVTCSPIWWLDEGDGNQIKNTVVANLVKQTVGNDVFEVEAKHRDKFQLFGNPRLLITANDLKALSSGSNEDMNDYTIDAWKERLSFLEVPAEAKDCMADYEYASGLLHSGAIARHILWLEQERYSEIMERKHRFSLEGSESVDKVDEIVSQSGKNSQQIAIWFENFLRYPEDKRTIAGDKFVVIKGQLRVGARAVLDSYQEMDDLRREKLNVTHVGKTLSTFFAHKTSGTKHVDREGRYTIDLSKLRARIAELGLSTDEEVVNCLRQLGVLV